MIRIVDEDELPAITSKEGEPPKRPDIHAQLSLLKELLASREAEIERLRTSDDLHEAKTSARQDILSKESLEKDEEVERLKDRHVRDVEIIARLHDNIDELKVEMEGLEAEVLRLRQPPPQVVQQTAPQPEVRQAAVIVRPQVVQQAAPQPADRQEPVAVRPQVVQPAAQPLQETDRPMQAEVTPPPRPQGHTATFMETQPGNEPPLEGSPVERGYQIETPVVRRPAAGTAPRDAQVIEAEQVPFEGQVQDAVVIPLDGEEVPEGAPTIKYRPLD